MNKNDIKSAAAGVFTGLCNGLFGSGGGVFAVVCLEKIMKLDERKSHATAIMIMLPLCIISLFGYMGHVDIDFGTAAAVIGGGVAGSIAGALFLKKLSGTAVKRIFAVFILAAAVRTVIS